jgi:hypothetical protein
VCTHRMKPRGAVEMLGMLSAGRDKGKLTSCIQHLLGVDAYNICFGSALYWVAESTGVSAARGMCANSLSKSTKTKKKV